MSLTNLAQIKGGLQLKADVVALQKSYDAAKVLTQIVKKVAEGETTANYNVEELLAELKGKIDAISGNGAEGDATSLASLQAAIDALKDKKIKDMVRVEFDVVSGVASLPANFDELVPGCDKNAALPVYTADNEVVLNENGEQLTIVPATGALNGVPSEVDADASAKDAEGKTIYKGKANFKAKFFPVGEWKLTDLPTNALLDNSEMQLVAYKTALDKLVVALTKDDALIEQVKKQVGEKAVQNQLDEALKAINDTVALKADKTAVEAVTTSVKAIDERVKAIEGATEEMVSDKVAVTAAVTEFALSKKPNAKLVEMVINHLVYREGEDFIVDRNAQKATWTLTAANGGFDIDAELTDDVRFNYFFKGAGEGVKPEPANEVATSNGWSKTFVFPAGKVAYDLSEVLTAEQLEDITDESAGGVNADGVGRKIRCFAVNGDKEVELNWVYENSITEEDKKAELEAIGFQKGAEFVFTPYELDGSRVLNFSAGYKPITLKLVYEK